MTTHRHGAEYGSEDEKAVQERQEQFTERLADLREQALALLAELEQRPQPQPPAEQEAFPAAVTPTATGSPIVAGVNNTAGSTTYLTAGGASGALYVNGDPGGVTGVGRTNPGVRGIGYQSNGMYGYAVPPNTLAGVRGDSPSGDGVYGYSVQGRGMVGASLRGIGALAFSRDQEALNAYSMESNGVRAATGSGAAAAVLAENSSGSAGGVAVAALGQSGVGLYASGGQAALQLGRSALAGPPTTGFHVAGELVLDANTNLYLCKVTGAPGTWKLVA